ncbi:hypothetical protein ACFWU5_02665 [Nocardia sp. NPDC058640]
MSETRILTLATIGERFGQTHPARDAQALTQLGATVHELVAAANDTLISA